MAEVVVVEDHPMVVNVIADAGMVTLPDPAADAATAAAAAST
jgi:hypothetical protein